MTAEESPMICVDRELPEELLSEAAQRAVEENPKNAPETANPFELVVTTGKLWKPGRTLHVRFLEGAPSMHARVEQVALEWTRHADIHFAFDNAMNAEIRVTFQQNGGNWSNVGTDALNLPAGQATMNLSLTPLSNDDTYRRVVLHEFGHALGCGHEHQNPAGGIRWNKQAAYAYYGKLGLTPAEVDFNIFRRLRKDQTQFTDFDRASIMLYPVPRSITDGTFEAPWNRQLSATDKRFIAQIYGPARTGSPVG